MRDIKYLSPTSIQQWEADKQEFYLKYLSDIRPDRLPQTMPMSVGSAFDAYVKSVLHKQLFGGTNPKFEFETLFTAQVESQNRDFAKEAGLVCYEAYKASGALSDLLILLMKANGEPQFEFEARGVVDSNDGAKLEREGFLGTIGHVVFLGKPDAFFTTKEGQKIILDWKVNGYCSKSNLSPRKGYVRVRDGWTWEKGPASRTNGNSHKEAHVIIENGIEINLNHQIQDIDDSWARQLAIYSWLCGAQVGDDITCAIDNLVCSPGKIKVAEFRSKIGVDFQKNLYNTSQDIWDTVHSDHIFREMSLEDSQKRCSVLDGVGEALSGGDSRDSWFNQAVRSH